MLQAFWIAGLEQLIHLQELRVGGVITLTSVGSAISLRLIDVSGAALEECRDNLQMLSELEIVGSMDGVWRDCHV